MDYIQDDIVLHCDGEEKDDRMENFEVVKADNEETVTLSDGEGRKISVVDVDIDGLISDDDIHVNNERMMHDEVYLYYGDADKDGEVNCVIDSRVLAPNDVAEILYFLPFFSPDT